VAAAIAQSLPAASSGPRPLVLIFDTDVGHSVGEILRSELGWTAPIVCLDGISVGAFDFIDIGARMEPSGTYPVIVKSLMFPAPRDGTQGEARLFDARRSTA
jgi:ethanolamine utilization protein EutA